MLLLPMIRVVLIMMMMVMILIIIVMIMMVMVIMMSMRRRVRISVIVMMTMRFQYVNCKPSAFAVGVVLTGVEVCLPLHRTCFYSFVRTVTIFLLLGCFTVLEYHTIAQNLPIQ